ncbi:hypothetical protein O7626_30830 [Micromonospora sp. WMMD1102]|uniref:hypothetical protein n=1 Tax=Micromonospora sp. WMMD1102 TaxID=3016105 RepID=UPI002414D705|nr:hypothetical protein [Micromonospora sp. WMMD1102]MDG4790265.1 hypothetical protein [Micromonospora sp. WMMD1102]
MQSGVLGDNWETEYEAMGVGWDMYLASLASYLRHFPGRHGVPAAAFRPGAGEPEQVWAAVADAFGITGGITEGTPARLTVDGLPPVDGVVDIAGLPTYFGVRTDDALYRFLHSGVDRGSVLVLGHHLFGADVDQASVERAWHGRRAGLQPDRLSQHLADLFAAGPALRGHPGGPDPDRYGGRRVGSAGLHRLGAERRSRTAPDARRPAPRGHDAGPGPGGRHRVPHR